MYFYSGALMYFHSGVDSSSGDAEARSAASFRHRPGSAATTTLARPNGTEEARTMLAEIYRWFTEGFDATALKEARSLLEQLG